MNYIMQSTNYRDFPVCISKSTAIGEADGSYAVHLSHRTAQRNRISTACYRVGIVFAR